MADVEREWVLRELDLFRHLSNEEVDVIGRSAPMPRLPSGGGLSVTTGGYQARSAR